MSASPGFLELLKDLLAPLGPVTVKRMFGGAGVYIDGQFIAIVDKDVLYFKTDEETRKHFEREGTGPFTYDTKHGPGTLTSYWRVPERLLDDADEMCQWAGQALGVARRARTASTGRSRTTAERVKTPDKPSRKKAEVAKGRGRPPA